MLGYSRSRRLAKQELTQRGFTLLSGNRVVMSSRNANRLIDKVEDSQITRQLGDGSLIKQLWKWVTDHKEQIWFVVKIILALVLMFMHIKSLTGNSDIFNLSNSVKWLPYPQEYLE